MEQSWGYEVDEMGHRPYPVAVATVRIPDRRNPRRTRDDIKCLVDSGSDTSGMPVRFLNRLGVTSGWEEDITDFFGETKKREVCHVRMSLCGRDCKIVKVVRLRKAPLLGKTPLGILGRDVLNDFRVVLDPQKGPKGRCEIE